MFGTIRKHQTWLWAVIITVIIISFVIFFSPTSRMNNDRGSAEYGSIHGQKVTQENYARTQREVYLRYFFMSGNWPDGEDAKRNGFDPMRETYYRLLLIRKQDDMGIRVSPAVVSQVARDMLRQFERIQITSPKMFIDRILKPRGFEADDLERFVRHELGIQELISTVGLAGKLITPEEAKGVYLREHEEMLTEAVFFPASNYLANAVATPEGIAQFYTNRLADYRIPERVQVSYVKFEATNFLAEADQELAKLTNINQRIDQVYEQRGTNFYKDVKSPEEAKDKIREEMRKELRLLAARKKANEFASRLYDQQPMRAENLAMFATTNGLTVQMSAPFTRDEGPKELKVAPNFTKAAFELDPTNNPFAGPIIGEDGVYVVALNKKLPSEIPSLEQVRERVEADLKFGQALILARAAGTDFSQSVSNGLAQGKTFAAVAAEAKLPVVELPPVSLSTRSLPEVEDRIQLNQLKQIAFSTPPGQVSSFQPTMEGGLMLHVKAKKAPDEVKLKTELPAFVNQMRQTRQTEAFNDWFRKEAERGLRDTPVVRQQRQPPEMGASKS